MKIFRTYITCAAVALLLLLNAQHRDLPEEPRRGDRFAWRGRTYEVLAPAGQPVWLWCDGFMNARRIHTKETGGEEKNG